MKKLRNSNNQQIYGNDDSQNDDEDSYNDKSESDEDDFEIEDRPAEKKIAPAVSPSKVLSNLGPGNSYS